MFGSRGKRSSYCLFVVMKTSEAADRVEAEPTKIEQEALDRKIKQGKAGEYVAKLIYNCAQSGSRFLDLARKSISTIPEELLSLKHLEVGALHSKHKQSIPKIVG